MGRPRRGDGRSAAIRAAQDTSEDGFVDLPPPRTIPPERKIAGTREEAIERGRVLGEDEATRRREEGRECSQRVARAIAYSVWEYDMKPHGVNYNKEFGVKESDLMESFERERKLGPK